MYSRTEEGVDRLPALKRVGLVSQTTQPVSEFKRIAKAVVDRCLRDGTDLRIRNTICRPTALRQSTVAELAGRATVMVIIGGRNSANTRHLAETAEQRGVPTHHITRADEIDPAWFHASDYVGVGAGTSTPDTDIDAVLERLRSVAMGLEGVASQP